jgi:hypothetical protein
MLENFSHGSLSLDFDNIVSQALREGREVRLERAERNGYVVIIDDVKLPNERDGFPREMFGWPLKDLEVDRGEATELVDELAESVERRWTKRRNETANTESHSVAEGLTEKTD